MTQPDKVPSLATQPPSWVWPSPRKDQRDDVDCGLDDDDSDDDLCSSQALNQILAAERAAYAAIAAAQTVQCTPPPDLEDFGTVCNRLTGKHTTLTVTQLAACQVCQQQVAYRWSAGRPEPDNAAMQQGRQLHEALEQEATIPDAIPIPVHSAEDAFVARLLDTYTKLTALWRVDGGGDGDDGNDGGDGGNDGNDGNKPGSGETGSTLVGDGGPPQIGRVREVWVAAKLHGMWVTGVVDELQWLRETQQARVVDDKTRGRSCLPDMARQAGTRLQVSLYRAMLHAMNCGGHSHAPQLLQLATLRGLDIHQPLSADLVAVLPADVLTNALAEHGVVTNAYGVRTDAHGVVTNAFEEQGVADVLCESSKDRAQGSSEVLHGVHHHTTHITLATLLPVLQRHLAAVVPPMSDILHIRYLLRATGEEFACVQVEHDPLWLQERLVWHGAFLQGSVAPSCARLRDVCFHCQFWGECPAGRVALGYPAEKPL